MSKRIVFMGAGAVRGYVDGRIARTGEDVPPIDLWPEHHGERYFGLHRHEQQGHDGVGNVASAIDSTGW